MKQKLVEGEKHLEASLLFVDFSKEFDTIQRGKRVKILQVCGLPKETVTAIMKKKYKFTKEMLGSHDGDTDFFEVVAGILQGDI